MSTCHWCGPTERELRPYGPGGSDICYPCMMADPAREKAASQNFGALLEGAEIVGDGIVTLTPSGPQPGVHLD